MLAKYTAAKEREVREDLRRHEAHQRLLNEKSAKEQQEEAEIRIRQRRLAEGEARENRNKEQLDLIAESGLVKIKPTQIQAIMTRTNVDHLNSFNL